MLDGGDRETIPTYPNNTNERAMMKRVIQPSDKRAEILQRLAAGESLRGVCASPGMPAAGTVCGWAARNEAFGKRYRAARRKGGAL